MAEQDPNVEGEYEEDEQEEKSSYKPPEKKALDEILSQDTEDESLRKYKESLLGVGAEGDRIFWPETPNCVIVKKLTFVSEGRDDIELDLTGDLSELKKGSFKIKEGASYRLKITFCVQRELVSGLKYVQKVYRLKKQVDKMDMMVGSYGPNPEPYEYLTPMEEAPSGMLSRGTYKVKSRFTDDDDHDILAWEWGFEIAKSWD